MNNFENVNSTSFYFRESNCFMVPSKSEDHLVKKNPVKMQTVSDENETEIFSDTNVSETQT